MGETLHPGLYMREVPASAPVQGASTSTVGFVGTAPKGQVSKPALITSWNQFVKEFGSFDADSYLAYAVRGFFENGGSRCYVVRAVKYTGSNKASAIATTDLSDSGTAIVINVSAKSDGVWGNDIAVEITTGSVATNFNVFIRYKGAVVETYRNVSLDDVEETVGVSEYVKFVVVGNAVPAPVSKSLVGGLDGIANMTDSDYIGDPAIKNGLCALDNVKVNIVAVPGITTIPVLKGIITYAEGRKDCFGILDVPMSSTVTGVRTFVKTTANLASEYAGVYYPWIKVNDPIGLGKSPLKTIPPSGHIAGAYARTDANSGVWKAPAGTDVQLRGAVGLEYELSDGEQGILNPENINCIRSFEGDGICVWGARTLSGGQYKYINVRRTVLFVENSLMSSMRWTVFRPNNETLWDAISSNVDSFLASLWAQGAFKGANSAAAYFVKCDADINTPDVVEQGMTFVDLGMAINKPAEFIIFRLALMR